MRPTATAVSPGTENLEVTGPALDLSTASDQPQQLNILETLIRESNRPRAYFVGRRGSRRNIRRNLGQRSQSLEGQQWIDSMFSLRNNCLVQNMNDMNGETNEGSS